ncbi:chromosomal replication initiator protein DnaA [Candidatus Beckwithbacteria bacterium]|nr:chromosomal replication initiator protein DnaA [Candidatus Beckwithbacteria bacterium]
MDKNKLWQETLIELKNHLSTSNIGVFFRGVFIAQTKNQDGKTIITISAPNAFSKKTIEQKHQEVLTTIFQKILKTPCDLRVNIQTPKEADPNTPSLFSPETTNLVANQAQKNLFKEAVAKTKLKPDYTFQNFAVSPTNEVAYAGATAVAKNPGKAYNPLFLYGDVGVGKTHLMQAVGIRILEKNPNYKLLYCAGEQFTNEIIEAIRLKKTIDFRSRYSKAKLLMIDDIQFIAGKNTVQEEFFHTFNAIQGAGGQVILTSDRPPHEIKLLEDRLRSRFEEGLTIDIQAPNFELRTAILLIKAKQMKQDLPMDVAQTIASHITSTRKLQGFLIKLFAIADLKNQETSSELALQLLQKQDEYGHEPTIQNHANPKEIVEAVSKHFNIPLTTLFGPKRARPIVVPRQYAMYLLKTDLNIPLMEIGRMFGGRDHTTVMHAVEKISKEVSQSEEMQLEFSTIRKQIYG